MLSNTLCFLVINNIQKLLNFDMQFAQKLSMFDCFSVLFQDINDILHLCSDVAHVKLACVCKSIQPSQLPPC